ncbi:MAG TPA: HPr(Ser) kinase/phosphatase [Leptospiraceae bacterium]|nr:HPr(Ser) kinase/phosphatase [Leptospiraceae bacterium]HMW04857.1 HPr(Ser) kinase/phosphatase [Leptospiraceae bacterium]HMX35060.1 HPr(Ser) kinase/phosphatase [Leptospiraceae bacterium]HMY30395.1 HPr(Ser) kinase/phosphatase [Leptospiraceae bacterium]HMZ66818.1 HPr(Ser) kinase/phosphatase [Leptospiraceae bacterium]
MSIASISVESIVRDHPELELQLISGERGISKKISNSEINRPGLSLTGFFDFFAYDRIQIFGKGEWAYLNSLTDDKVDIIAEKFFSYPINCIIFTHGNMPKQKIVEKADNLNIPLFVSPMSTHKFITLISDILNKSLAPRTMRHGVLIEVFGIGILLSGKSGVGKSETALELIERGHRLVADDMVEIRRYSESYLIGTCSDILSHHMEIRGLGIINIKDIFGVGSVRDSKLIELIINIEEWSENVDYDRTGLDEETDEILGVKIPFLKIPIKPGRNIPIIVETAAMNQRLKKMGTFGAREFNNKLTNYIEQIKIEKSHVKD